MKKLVLFIVMISLLGMNEASSQWSTNGNNIYNTNSGNVGIGTDNPLGLLYVMKNTGEPMITIRNLGGGGGASYSMIDDGSGADWKFKATITGGFKIRDHANSLDVFVIEPNSFANAFYIKSFGNIGIGTSAPENSALVDMSSTTMGFLPPRMTNAQILAIENPADGLMVYCTDCSNDGLGRISIFMVGNWYTLSIDNCLNPPDAPSSGTHVSSETGIIWNWNPVTGAAGYKWNITNDYNTAIDLGNSTSYSESGLNCNASYTRYIWAYNMLCTSVSTAILQTTLDCSNPFACLGTPTVLYEGQTYNTVQVGTQCWLQENLNVGIQISGDLNQTDNYIIEKYCYENNPSNCDQYGGLYQWEEIMKYTTSEGTQGICPDGWHVPTNGEWCELATYLDASVNCNTIGGTGTNIGYQLKSASGWYLGGNGSNSSGFTGLPGGVRYPTNFDWITKNGDFWTSSLQSSTAHYWVLGYGSNLIGHYLIELSNYDAISVRCLKNN